MLKCGVPNMCNMHVKENESTNQIQEFNIIQKSNKLSLMTAAVYFHMHLES